MRVLNSHVIGTARLTWPQFKALKGERIASALVLAAAAFSVIGFLVAAYFRLTFGYPMWVMEVPALQAVRRITEGQLLYAAPSLSYVAPLYAPLYFYVSAAFASFLGVGLPALRLASLVASICSAALIGHLVWRETRNLVVVVVATGLFIASTALTALTFDLARVDALVVALLLGAIAASRAAESNSSRGLSFQFVSGALTSLAILTKQTAFVLVVPLLVNATFAARARGAIAFLLGVGIGIALAGLLLWHQFGDWAQFYLIQLPSDHAVSLDNVGAFWGQKILPSYSIPLAFAPVFFIGRWLDRDYALVRFWLLAAIGMISMAWGASLNVWSDDNVLLPALAVLSILFGLGLEEALKRIRPATGQARAFRVYLLVLVATQFMVVHYSPRATSPLRSDVWAGDRMVTLLGNLPGRVYGPDFAEYLHLAGKGENSFGLSVLELAGGFGGKPLQPWGSWMAAYENALDQREFDELVLDPQSVAFFLADGANRHGYVDTGPLVPPGDVLDLWGSRYAARPHIWVPRERASVS